MNLDWLAIYFAYGNIHVSMLFSQIIPPSPSPRVQKSALYICVSFAVSHIGLLSGKTTRSKDLGARPGLCAGGGEATPGWSSESPPDHGRAKLGDSRPPQGEAHQVWVPLTWDLKQTLAGFRDTPWRPQFCPVLLLPIKILGTQSLPTRPEGPESLAAVPSPSMRNSTSVSGLRPVGGEPQASP